MGDVDYSKIYSATYSNVSFSLYFFLFLSYLPPTLTILVLRMPLVWKRGVTDIA